ncbi:Mitochondrial substrate carrier family protein [Hirschfeldia incana]|nr:Mitochondrial substrate carrier family protein [Hirschfeldia incana]
MIGDISPPVASIPVVEGNAQVKKPKKLLPPLSTVASHFGTSGVSVALATGVTHPLDVLKVRLQMQHVGQRGPLIGMTGIFLQLMKKEGPRSLYLGLTPALTRSVLYGGLRLGLYEPTKFCFDWALGSSTNVLVKIASGAFAGAFATALTNPVEVVKVRLQMNPNAVPIAEVREIVSKEGIGALWKGVGPAMVRAAALTASQLATYDETKRILVKRTSLEEGFHLHLCSSMVAGVVSTLITAPIDMIKTRLMLQQASGSVKSYRNGFHCGYKVIRKEGPLALYKGGFTIFARLGPQTMITFLLCEKLRSLAGLHKM